MCMRAIKAYKSNINGPIKWYSVLVRVNKQRNGHPCHTVLYLQHDTIKLKKKNYLLYHTIIQYSTVHIIGHVLYP